jgi:hypothetical protein
MPYRSTLIILLLMAGVAQLWGEDTLNDGRLRRVTMEIIVNELENKGVKVAFIENPFDLAKAITLKEEAKTIEGLPESERTWREKMILRDFQQGTIPGICVIGYAGESYDIDLPPNLSNHDVAKVTLQKVAALDPRYELIWSNGFPVICPCHDDVRDIRINFSTTNTPAFDAVGQLGQELARHGINLGYSSVGPTPPDKIYGTNIVTVNFVNTPLVEALCRFAEALGPYYNWEMLEIKGYGRNFGFGQVAPPSS